MLISIGSLPKRSSISTSFNFATETSPLIHTGQGSHLAPCLFTDIQDFFFHMGIGRGNGEDDLIHIVLSHGVCDLVSATDDRHAPEEFTMAAGIIIDNTFGVQIQIAAGLDFL